MKGDDAKDFKILMIAKECKSITSQKIEGLTNGAKIVHAMTGTTQMIRQDAFLCFICTYEIPMYDIDAEPWEGPSEWCERAFAAKTIEELIEHVKHDLNVEVSNA